MKEKLQHSMNCGATGFDGYDAGECTCGLQWRISLQTEQTMHAAWRKRATEAEARITSLEIAANVLIDYCEAHGWGIMPEPFDSINPLLELLGRGKGETLK